MPCPPPGDLPDPGIKPTFLTFSVLTGGFFTTSTTWEARLVHSISVQYVGIMIIITVHEIFILLKQVHSSFFSLMQSPSSPSSASSCDSVPPCQERPSSDGWKVERQRQACRGGPDRLRNQEPPEDDPGADPNIQGSFGGSWVPNPPLPKEPLGEQRSQPSKAAS